MGKFWGMIHGLRPVIMMVTVQIANAGMAILYKVAGKNGMSLQVLIAYRFILASATVVPLALIIERKNRPNLTRKIVLQAFFSSLFGGSIAQNLYAESLVLTSVTIVVAITNLVPAMTFILAVLFRIEGLGLKTSAGKAKMVGTLVCIGGAMLFTFYKGCEINILSTHFDLLHKSQQAEGHVATTHRKSNNNILGAVLALVCCSSISFSLIIQAKMCEIYPCHYSSTALISIMGSFQAVVLALCIERDWTQWKLGWNLNLLTVAYMGIVAGIVWAFIMSCVREMGPLFVAVFNTLLLVLVAIGGALFLNEKLFLGSLLGAVTIICGLYMVLWGKSKEKKKITHVVPSRNSKDATEVEENARGSNVGFDHDNNAVAMSPNFVPESETLQVFYEEKEDLEARVSTPQTKSKT